MSSPLSALVADAASAAHGEARRMAYGVLKNSVEATKEASVQFAADGQLRWRRLGAGLEAGDEAIRVAAVCVKAAAARAGVPGWNRSGEKRRHRWKRPRWPGMAA